jgi:ATP-dependent helicase HrpB
VSDRLPIDDALPALKSALARAGRAVLMAPPGAGKTTRVPLALLDQVTGRIVMLEPRRLAARAAAERMAETLGEPVGQTVGYRIRGEAKTSRATRIEVVTEGILTRMIQSDPELTGIGLVIFDEFHERSLNADLGLALVWEARSALREDLQIVVMSATLDAEPVAALLGDAPVVRSEGRAYPVETRWLGRPLATGMRLEAAVAGLVEQAVHESAESGLGGGVLVFLPGEGEIRRVEALLKPRLPADVVLRPLFGAMDFAAQRAAIAPAASGRKVVLATSIAETSLTIQDIRVVVDAGRARRARFDPASGMARLVTERVSRAEAEQRRGRAGRVAEGLCYRLWTKGEEGALPAFAPPEIAVADLSGLALELALWGSDGADLAFLTPPPAPALAEARALLTGLGAFDARGHITAHGRALAALPLHPRLGHMLVTAGPAAATLAATLAERDPIRGAPADLSLRIAAVANPGRYESDHPHSVHRGTVDRIRTEAKRLARMVQPGLARPFSLAEMAALAYPDRIGLRRKGDEARYVLSGGKGAVVDALDALAKSRLIVATDLDGDPREARVRQGIALADAELRALYGDQIGWVDVCEWSKREGRVVARRQERFGALVLEDRHWPDAPPEALARGALDGLRQIGLTFTPAARRFRARLDILRADGADLPDLSDEVLLAGTALLPFLRGKRTEADLRGMDLTEALRAQLDWEQMSLLDRLAPSHFETPLGRRVPIDYDGAAPAIEVKLPEMYGVTVHPTVGPKRHPLRISLLSPGMKPIQVTMDLPGFWDGSYAEVRKEMRGRYPRHPWPENPREADPTTRAKPRGT